MSPKIWWSNGIFFVSVHIAAILSAIHWPPQSVPRASLILSFVVWQLGTFGITVGYHRLYSHRAFRANLGIRIILTAMGSSAFQGSIKVSGSVSGVYINTSGVMVSSGGALGIVFIIDLQTTLFMTPMQPPEGYFTPISAGFSSNPSMNDWSLLIAKIFSATPS